MSDTSRYAIYYAPPEQSALWRFGSAVLGYDAATGRDVAHLPLPGIEAAEWPALSAEPRLYGFHATLKSPFRLASGMTVNDLYDAIEDLAPRQTPVILEGLSVTRIGSFVALTPVGDVLELDGLALRVTSELDVLRAPLTEQEMQKRLKTALSERQRSHLDRFGSPYVGEDFRFHMTLSGSLPPDRIDAVAAALTSAYAEAVPTGTVDVDALTVFEQAEPGAPFRVGERIPLG
jgi:putative phosphonate metabolism protein